MLNKLQDSLRLSAAWSHQRILRFGLQLKHERLEDFSANRHRCILRKPKFQLNLNSLIFPKWRAWVKVAFKVWHVRRAILMTFQRSEILDDQLDRAANAGVGSYVSKKEIIKAFYLNKRPWMPCWQSNHFWNQRSTVPFQSSGFELGSLESQVSILTTRPIAIL